MYAPQREREQQLDRLEHAAGARERDADRPMGKVIRLSKDRRQLGAVDTRVGLGDQHGDVVEAQVIAGLDHAPDLARDRLELAPHARVLQNRDAFVGLDGRAFAHRLAPQDVALETMQQGRRG